MVTPKLLALREEYFEFRTQDVNNGSHNIEIRIANTIWSELFDHCQPTLAELDEYTNDIIMTSKSMGYVMLKAGLWNDK